MVLFNPVLSNPILFSISSSYNSKTSEFSSPLCLPLKLSPLWYCSPSHFPLIPSHGPSTPRSPSHHYPSITDLSADSSTHSTLLFFILTCYWILKRSYLLISYLSITPSPPTTYLFCCSLHLILSVLSTHPLALHPSMLFPVVPLALYTHHTFCRVCCSSLLKQFNN